MTRRWLTEDRSWRIGNLLISLGAAGLVLGVLREAYNLPTLVLGSIALIVLGTSLYLLQWLPRKGPKPPERPSIRLRLNNLIQEGESMRQNIAANPSSRADGMLAEYGGPLFMQVFAWTERVWSALTEGAADLTYLFDNKTIPDLTYRGMREYVEERISELREIMDRLPPEPPRSS
jgi:hypothetical protein